ncbi:hypothetical protein PAAG_11687 [Paracoccidioides lutzii Pb01]|uniref:Uncharacterized protein n=1 Tax=Paracoccidioides lutzii (strain ATCC MYA-826 / Pb01) TaxID=502779 RepID=A0A0A2V185_PARBA|nr:hypothetical protein PAAG_11687 [Paracoccidioides lutzii Pb01]KGQ01561.1 hypothetical protein PAAG_11687 [Paracoccidioides lutzii Pb01]
MPGWAWRGLSLLRQPFVGRPSRRFLLLPSYHGDARAFLLTTGRGRGSGSGSGSAKSTPPCSMNELTAAAAVPRSGRTTLPALHLLTTSSRASPDILLPSPPPPVSISCSRIRQFPYLSPLYSTPPRTAGKTLIPPSGRQTSGRPSKEK